MTDWRGLYSLGWKGEITPDAFAHPAKFARGLIRHIYQHAIDEGWLHAGDTVLDPFGGVALGALDAMRYGLNWRGVELEQRFVDLGSRNIELWNKRYAARLPMWGSAELLQGDSRELAKVLVGANGAVSSPPFGNSLSNKPSEQILAGSGGRMGESCKSDEFYGSTPGNLGNLPAGDFRAAISSPPYADGCAHTGGDDPKPENIQGGEYRGVGLAGAISSPPYSEARIGQESGQAQCGHNDAYGATPGQLGAMRASVSSPPFENGLPQQDRNFTAPHDSTRNLQDAVYGIAPGNIGNQNGDDFWTAARAIIEQVYQVLQPGAHAIWVLKAFVKDKAIVDFPDQWRQMCEAVGFITLHVHLAWLVEDRGNARALMQVGDLQPGDVANVTGKKKKKVQKAIVERKSFFRRLAEKNGSPRIDFEIVLCMRKPE